MSFIEKLKSFTERFNWLDSLAQEGSELPEIFDDEFIRLVREKTGFDLNQQYGMDINVDRQLRGFSEFVILRNKLLSNDIHHGYQITIIFKANNPGFYITLNLGTGNDNYTSENDKRITEFWKNYFNLPTTYINPTKDFKEVLRHDALHDQLITSSEFTLENLNEENFFCELKKMLVLMERIHIKTGGDWENANYKISNETYYHDLETKIVKNANIQELVDQIVIRDWHDKNITKHHTRREQLQIIEKYKNALMNETLEIVECLVEPGVIASIEFFDGEQILTRKFMDVHTMIRKVILNDFEKRFYRNTVDSIAAIYHYVGNVNHEFGL